LQSGQPRHKALRADEVAQVVEHLPSKSEALSSFPSITKKKEKTKGSKYAKFQNNLK
jgi:hypothetical protein